MASSYQVGTPRVTLHRNLQHRDSGPKHRPRRRDASRDARPADRFNPGATVACHERWVHTEYVGRIIGTILGAILAIWLAFTAAGGIFATLKTFLIVGLIAMAVFIVVWLVARGTRRG